LSSSPSSSPLSELPRIKRATTAVLRVASGARSGIRYPLSADFATLGRHPTCDLAFDPEKDVEVSARHAAVFRHGPGYVVRDLGSTNGTWVNGTRVRGDRSLEPGDRIRLGAKGPEIEFAVEEVEERAAPAPAPTPGSVPVAPAPAAPAPPRKAVIGQEQSTTDLKLRVEVARQTERLRRRLLGATLIVITAVALLIGWLVWSAYQGRLELARRRDQLVARADSIGNVFRTAAEQSAGLQPALDSARQDTEALRGVIAREATNDRAIETLDSRLTGNIARGAPLLRAARFDISAITSANARGTVMVFVEKSDGNRALATGFVVRTRADTGWIVTSRQTLLDGAGQAPTRIAVAFNGGKLAWRARLTATHRSADLALIRVLAWGHVFPLRALNLSPAPTAGEPVAIMGFPGGPNAGGGNWTERGLKVLTSKGTVESVSGSQLVIDGYGAPAAGGSPVFNSAGEVVGIISGEPASRLLQAVSTSELRVWETLVTQ
jgi:pSer/pThr/pTyr-binding forkhead associated (FHA) protein/S1-C subfamily serine protease